MGYMNSSESKKIKKVITENIEILAESLEEIEVSYKEPCLVVYGEGGSMMSEVVDGLLLRDQKIMLIERANNGCLDFPASVEGKRAVIVTDIEKNEVGTDSDQSEELVALYQKVKKANAILLVTAKTLNYKVPLTTYRLAVKIGEMSADGSSHLSVNGYL